MLKTTSDNKFPNGRWELISEESSNNDLGSYIIISLPKLQAGPSADQPLATYHDFKLNGSDFTGRWSHPEYGSGDANGRFDDDGKLHMHFPVDDTYYVFTRAPRAAPRLTIFRQRWSAAVKAAVASPAMLAAVAAPRKPTCPKCARTIIYWPVLLWTCDVCGKEGTPGSDGTWWCPTKTSGCDWGCCKSCYETLSGRVFNADGTVRP